MSIISFENLPTPEKPAFKRLEPGSHYVRVLSMAEEFKEYMMDKKDPLKPASNRGGSGRSITIVYETFGNKEEWQNGKKIYHALPLDGEYHKITKAVFFAIFPEQNAATFDIEAAKGRCVEVILKYNVDKATGIDRKYPNVIKVLPYVGTVPSIDSLQAHEDYNLSDVPF